MYPFLLPFQIPDSSFFYSHSIVAKILSLYNGQQKMPYKQRLVWKLSSRTLRVLRPTDKLTSYLPTIVEHNNAQHNVSNNLRSRYVHINAIWRLFDLHNCKTKWHSDHFRATTDVHLATND
jgi:hypothetical protein